MSNRWKLASYRTYRHNDCLSFQMLLIIINLDFYLQTVKFTKPKQDEYK